MASVSGNRNPYKCVDVVVEIDTNIVGVVESMTIELEHEGGIEHMYGTVRGRHAVGGERATFSLRRWYNADSDVDLFIDLMSDKTPFGLSGYISGFESATHITLSDCLAYRYRPVYGAPNDKVGEEITGEATYWSTGLA